MKTFDLPFSNLFRTTFDIIHYKYLHYCNSLDPRQTHLYNYLDESAIQPIKDEALQMIDENPGLREVAISTNFIEQFGRTSEGNFHYFFLSISNIKLAANLN